MRCSKTAIHRKNIPGGDKTIDYDYDRFGNRAGLTLNDGTVSAATYDYDKRNRLTAATLPDTQTYSFTYNDTDELLDKVYPNGITTSHGYQANGPMTSITATGPAGTVQDLQYTYDAALNIDTHAPGDHRRAGTVAWTSRHEALSSNIFSGGKIPPQRRHQAVSHDPM